MKRKPFPEAQIIGIPKEAEAGAAVTDLCRRHGMSSATYYAWKATGQRFRILNKIVDDVTREFLRAVLDTSISGRQVVVSWAA